MSSTFEKILRLIEARNVKISEHGYDKMAAEGILFHGIMVNIKKGIPIEDYPCYYKGECVLVLQNDDEGNPLHTVWGIPKDKQSPAVLITAYRPDPNLWTEDLMRRKK